MARFRKKRRPKKQSNRGRQTLNRRLHGGQTLEPRLMLTTIDVTTTDDVINADDGVTSLREAVIAANAITTGDVTINLAGGFYTLTRLGTDDTAQRGDLDLSRSVTIQAPEDFALGFGALISGGEETRVFDVQGSGEIDVTFRNLAIFEGRGRGGGIEAEPNGGTITIEDSIISDNEWRGSDTELASGGGIYIDGGTLIIDNTRVIDNSATGSRGETETSENAVDDGGDGQVARGGGIYAINTDVTVRNGSSISGNVADGGDGGSGGDTGGDAASASGGGIFIDGGSLVVVDSEIAGNQALGGLGGNAQDSTGGRGGSALGGGIAVYNQTTEVTFESSQIYDNEALAGRGGHSRSDDGDGGDGRGGGTGSGGGLFTQAPVLNLIDTAFGTNLARGGDGGQTILQTAGAGGRAFGGAISIDVVADVNIRGTMNFAGEFDLENPEAGVTTATAIFNGNEAVGGNGGFKRQTEKAGGTAGVGGLANGGAIYHIATGTLDIDQAYFVSNIARGGFGGEGGVFLAEASGDNEDQLSTGTAGGTNGTGRGGAIFTNSDLTLTGSSLIGNIATGGGTGRQDRVAAGSGGIDREGNGTDGGNGADGFGGAIFLNRASATIEDSGLASNTAQGGIGGQGGTAFAYRNADGDIGNGLGGDGGDGGDGIGGAIFARLDTDNTLTLNRTVLSANKAIGGQGGNAGFGAMVGNESKAGPARGGDGGVGGVGRGGGAYVELDSGATNGSSVDVDDTIVSGGRVVGGDGGDGGHGGSGYILEFESGEDGDIGLAGVSGNAGNGGHGGDAAGGGFYLTNVHAEITNTTIDSNVASSGWGGDGGFGGSGNLSNQSLGFDQTFAGLGSDTAFPNYGGNGGDGGDGGDAAGGGLRVLGGSLELENSTVYRNVVVAGAGGDGGDGGVGELGGGDGGNGGNGGMARGGGLFGLGGSPQINIVGSTITDNTVNAGPAGIGGQAGPVDTISGPGSSDAVQLAVGRYQSRLTGGETFASDGGFVVLTPAGDSYELFVASSSAVLTNSAGMVDPALASIEQDDFDEGSNDLASDFTNDGTTAAAIFATGAAGIGVAATAFAIQSALTGSIVIGGAATAGATVGGTLLVTALPIAGFAATVTVALVVIVKIGVALATGASFEEAVESAIDVPDTGSGPNLTALFGNPNSSETFIVSEFLGPGNDGAAGQAGTVAGSGIASDAHLSRTIVANNSARGRQFSKELGFLVDEPLISAIPGENYFGDVEIEPPARPGTIASSALVIEQTLFDIDTDDVAPEGVVTSDGTNLIGATTSSTFAADFTGTPSNPLDPGLESGLGLHGGITPTLALKDNSPARGAIPTSATSPTSQNDHTWVDRADIGAWGGPLGVVDRHVFYENSALDDPDGPGPMTGAGADASDDAAIDATKNALLAGQQASFAHYTSYPRGLNGLMIDIAGLPADELTADDFQFATGGGASGVWTPLVIPPETPLAVTIREDAGESGSDRVTLTWPDSVAVKNEWLRITLKANDNTGLAEPDVHYWGNQVGETGNDDGNTRVNSGDVTAIVSRLSGIFDTAGPDNSFDLNRDGKVNSGDITVAIANSSYLSSLELFRAPGGHDAQISLLTVPAIRAEANWAELDAVAEEISRRPDYRANRIDPFFSNQRARFERREEDGAEEVDPVSSEERDDLFADDTQLEEVIRISRQPNETPNRRALNYNFSKRGPAILRSPIKRVTTLVVALVALLAAEAPATLVFEVGNATATVGDSTVTVPIDVSGPDGFNSVTVAFGVGDGGPLVSGAPGVDPTIPVINYGPASAGAVWDGASVTTGQQNPTGSGVSILTMNLPTASNVTASDTERLMNLVLDLTGVLTPGSFELAFEFVPGNSFAFPATGLSSVDFTATNGTLTVNAIPEPGGLGILIVAAGVATRLAWLKRHRKAA